MNRIASVVVLFLLFDSLASAQTPQYEEDKNLADLTKEKLIGEWEGALKDGTIVALKFTDEFVVVSFLPRGTDREQARIAAKYSTGNIRQVPFGGTGIGARDDYAKFHDKLKALGRGFGVGNTGFDIIAKTNEVRIMGVDSFSAKAKPTRDGALLVSGRFKINAGFYGIDRMLPETRIERVKSIDPEK